MYTQTTQQKLVKTLYQTPCFCQNLQKLPKYSTLLTNLVHVFIPSNFIQV